MPSRVTAKFKQELIDKLIGQSVLVTSEKTNGASCATWSYDRNDIIQLLNI